MCTHDLSWLGDIDVIAAVGDSLTSATAANSAALWEVLIENRGVSWCIGGQGTWRTHLTLPNILKEFNPNLFGWEIANELGICCENECILKKNMYCFRYSLTDSYNVHKAAQFNVAENIATTSDMPYNAEKLVNRMSLDKRWVVFFFFYFLWSSKNGFGHSLLHGRFLRIFFSFALPWKDCQYST